ncbi:MAG TPA: efflux RND transporter permease subunit, partial [Thermoanaerobaculia bacterium]
IATVPVAVRKGATVRIGDVATVFPGAPDRTALAAGNGRDAALVTVAQQPGADVLAVARGVFDALSGDVASALPSGLKISKVYDLAEFVSTAIANVRDAILIGGFLAILVLIAFLRDWRMTVVSALTLPLTVVSTFLFMSVFGESINLMSMGGLAVAIGLVIDDAVVVVENIHRRLAAGDAHPVESATVELVAPVVGSTLTTVVVLLPLGLLEGVVGQFFRALSLTLSVAVLISLALSLTLIPLLARLVYFQHIGGSRHHPLAERALHCERPRAAARDGWLARSYARTLGAAMARPRMALLAVLLLGAGGALLASRLPSGFLPAMDEGGFVIDYLTPPGTAIEETDRTIRKVERLLQETPEVAAFARRTGAELGLFVTAPNKGDILVRLKPRDQRRRSADEIIDDLRGKVRAALPGLDVEFVQILQDMLGDLEGAPTPIEVKVFGDDAEALERVAGEVEPLLAKVRGVVDVVGPQRGSPEVVWEIDPVAAGRVGLTADQVSSQLASAWLGKTATSLRLLDRSIPVRVRYPDPDRTSPDRLAATPLKTADGRLVPLSTLAHAVASDGQSTLYRENLRQLVLLTARLEGRDLGSAVAEIQKRLKGVRLPVGYSVEVGGQYEAQRQSFRDLLLVFAAAAFLVLTVLVFEFRAFIPALLLLAAAPLSLGGSFLLLRLTGTELN